MKTQFHLVINDRGTTRTSKTKPDLKSNEISIVFALELPDKIFQRPQLEAKIQLTEKDLPVQHIPIDVQDNIQNALQQATGVHVQLHIIQPEE